MMVVHPEIVHTVVELGVEIEYINDSKGRVEVHQRHKSPTGHTLAIACQHKPKSTGAANVF